MTDQTVSILLAIICVLFSLSLIGTLVGRYVYRRMHNLPTGDCACCHVNTQKLLKKWHKTHKLD